MLQPWPPIASTIRLDPLQTLQAWSVLTFKCKVWGARPICFSFQKQKQLNLSDKTTTTLRKSSIVLLWGHLPKIKAKKINWKRTIRARMHTNKTSLRIIRLHTSKEWLMKQSSSTFWPVIGIHIEISSRRCRNCGQHSLVVKMSKKGSKLRRIWFRQIIARELWGRATRTTPNPLPPQIS